MRAGFWLGLGLAGLGLFDACLPEVTIDDTLGPDTKVGSEQGGTGGVAGTGPGAGKGATAGAATMNAGGAAGSTSGTEGVGAEGGISLVDPTAAGGAAGAMGGAGTPGDSGGVGGTAASAGAGGTSAAAGAGGAAGDVCPDGLTKEQACNAYCALYSEACGDFPLAYDYQGPGDCSLFCYDSDWEIGTIAQPNSIMCRCNHANLALLRGQTPHCYHAARVPSMTGGCEIPPP